MNDRFSTANQFKTKTGHDNVIRPIEVVLPGCDDHVCDIIRDAPIGAELSFAALRASEKARVNVDVRVENAWHTLALDLDVCAGLTTGKCPLTAGGNYTYRSSTNAGDTAAGTRTSLRLLLFDDNNYVIACTQIAVLYRD